MADIKGETFEANSFHHGSKKMKYQVYAVVDEQSVTTVNEDGSILVSEDDLKLRTPVQSEISAETSSPLNIGLTKMRPQIFQHKTESSSCSNASSVILPVNFRSHIYQETSKEAYSFRSSIDSSSSKAFDRASSLTKKEDEEISQECNYTTAPKEKQQAEIIDRRSFSDYLDNLNCTSQTVRRSRDDFFVKESLESSMSKPSKADNGDTFNVGFDLNEDFNANGMDCIQPAVAAVSSHDSVIVKVVAKHGVSSGHPIIPLKFEGGLGWKGSAETSAFRPTALSKNASKKALSENQPRQVFTGIDLNVASVEEDDVANGIQYLKQDKSPWIDLNRLYDGDDELTQPSPTKTENTFLVDLNLIADTSIVDPVFVTRGKQDSDFTSHGYYLNNMTALQHRVASLQQPNLPFLSQSLPPHIYSSMEAPLRRSIHAGYSYEDNLSTHESKMDKARQSFFLAKMSESRQSPFLGLNTPMGEQVQHQGAWYATAMKRKETEGGLECYRGGYNRCG